MIDGGKIRARQDNIFKHLKKCFIIGQPFKIAKKHDRTAAIFVSQNDPYRAVAAL